MKNCIKSIIGLIAATITSASAIAANDSNVKVIKTTDSSENTSFFYYDAENMLKWEINGTTRYEYTYNAAGQCIKKQTYSWVPAKEEYTIGAYETYEYDNTGNMVKKVVMKVPYGKTEYTEDDTFENYVYENGIAKTWDNTYKGDLYYNFRNNITKDANGNITSIVTERFDPDDKDKGWVTYSTDIYKDGNISSTEYKSIKTEYSYTSLKAEYAPTNFKAVNNNGNVTLSWDAVSGAEKYIISYDQTRKEVEGLTCTETVGTGNRLFAIQAVVSGDVRNASFTSAEIVDEGKKAITDLTLVSITETEEETESTELSGKRTFYNIALSWTLPEGHSKIEKFYIYYNSKTYGNDCYASASNPSSTSYTLKIDPFEVTEWDSEGVPFKGIDTPVYVTIIYATGESEKSNILIVNPFKTLGHEGDTPSSIDEIKKSPTAGSVKKYIDNGRIIISAKGKKYTTTAVEAK